jgi:hypothetical protein
VLSSLQGLFHSIRVVDGGDDLFITDIYPSRIQYCNFNNLYNIQDLSGIFQSCNQIQTLDNINS